MSVNIFRPLEGPERTEKYFRKMIRKKIKDAFMVCLKQEKKLKLQFVFSVRRPWLHISMHVPAGYCGQGSVCTAHLTWDPASCPVWFHFILLLWVLSGINENIPPRQTEFRAIKDFNLRILCISDMIHRSNRGLVCRTVWVRHVRRGIWQESHSP